MADITGMKFGNAVIEDYYSNILKELPAQTIERASISTPEQSVDSIAERVRSYLHPQYEEAVRKRQAQTQQNNASIDTDATSRGMRTSTWVTDNKQRQLAAEAADVASLGSNYTAALAERVSSEYENYLNRKSGIDEVNANNQIEVDKWNSNVKSVLEELAYKRALEEYARTPLGRPAYQAAHPVNRSGGGYSSGLSGGSGYTRPSNTNDTNRSGTVNALDKYLGKQIASESKSDADWTKYLPKTTSTAASKSSYKVTKPYTKTM